MSQQLNDRIETLESRLAFAEYTVEQLNDEVTTQGRELDRLKHQIQLLVDKLQSVQPSPGFFATANRYYRATT